MENKDLVEILKSEPLKFNLKEIEKIMNDELSKNPDEMNVDLVDLCIKTIEQNCGRNSINNKNDKKANHLKLTKLLTAAIIIIIVLGICIPVSAKLFINDTKGNIVSVNGENLNVDLKNGKNQAEIYSDENISIIKNLSNKGADKIILPKDIIMGDESNYSDITVEKYNYGSTYIFNFSFEHSVSGSVTIDRVNNKKYFNPKSQIQNEFNMIKQIEVNGLDVLVLSDDKVALITYTDKLTNYDILMDNCSYNKAIRIAHTLEIQGK